MLETSTLTPPMPRLSPREFQKIRELARQKFGLDLKPGKEELVSSRLGKKLREGGFRSFQEYYDAVQRDATGESLIALIDALTTNYTMFFREADHFDFLRSKVLPGLRSRGEIRIWCAAAATGEEPYSLAITLFETLGMAHAHQIHVLATDISTRALAAAEQGVYPAERFAQLPTAVRRRYLLQGRATAEGFYKMRPEVRQRVEFRRLNLVEPIRHRAPFPVIFCRNVMIYFGQETRQDVVRRMIEWLEPGGYLFVGHSESLSGKEYALEYVQPAVYRKPADSRWRIGRRGTADND